MTQVAQTILQQLGGNRFCVMTGAKNFVGGENTLQFKLPARFAKQGINVVKVTLNALDLYDVEFGKLWGVNYKVIETVEGLYFDMLQKTFKDITGLDTHL